MSKRQNVVKVATEEVQGAGSYVIVRKLTVGEAMEVLQDGQAHAKAARQQMVEAGEDELDRRMVQEMIDSEVAVGNMRWAIRRFRDHIREWDWSDDDGAPMPLPKDDDDVANLLTMEEMQALSEAMSPSKANAEVKN